MLLTASTAALTPFVTARLVMGGARQGVDGAAVLIDGQIAGPSRQTVPERATPLSCVFSGDGAEARRFRVLRNAGRR